MNNVQPIDATAAALAARLQAIDYDSLPISDYNKRYIRNLKPALPYYMKIYADCLRKGIIATGLAPVDITLVDYGGGSGFLSILAKEAGIGRVIYTDLNPLSVATIHRLKEIAGTGPDVILQGDSADFAAWCTTQAVKPQLLIATDLIEHIYRLESFFADLTAINDSLLMLFTTASTPFNPYVKRRLHKAMDGCERGTVHTPNYYTLRYQYIKKEYPHLTEEETARWSKQTRGMVYSDIDKAIQSRCLPHPADAHNTCDPATGNWTERILPITAYRSLLSAHQYTVRVEKGFYNTQRRAPLLSFACRCINRLIALSGKAGFIAAPFIILTCRKQGT